MIAFEFNRFFFFLFFRVQKFDYFKEPKHGYGNVGDLDSPTSFDEIERPPLRQIDKYLRVEFFGLSARYTVSVMAMMGFIISFGMRCNMGMAKLEKERESGVSWLDATISYQIDENCFTRWFSNRVFVDSIETKWAKAKSKKKLIFIEANEKKKKRQNESDSVDSVGRRWKQCRF